jgi:hypothetical protein
VSVVIGVVAIIVCGIITIPVSVVVSIPVVVVRITPEGRVAPPTPAKTKMEGGVEPGIVPGVVKKPNIAGRVIPKAHVRIVKTVDPG